MDLKAHEKVHALLAECQHVILEKSQNHLLAPELRLSTPAKWLIKHISGSNEVRDLMWLIDSHEDYWYLLNYVIHSNDPFVIWEIEKEFKSSSEWGPFIFSLVASCFASRLQGVAKWDTWAADHTIAWMDMYKPF